MRIFTRRDDVRADLGRVAEETYVCGFGVGRILLTGGLPFELELPSSRRDAASRHSSSPWVLALERYFAGEPVMFDLDVDAYAAALDLTSFERDVYAALARIPRGAVVSYCHLARLAGRPRAYRAVGSVMARNRLPVILPCHRVIRNDGRLGFYGDDPMWKERLLALEGVSIREGKVA